MDVSKIPPGRYPPLEINVLIQIPQGGVPVKYELDKASGALFVNRFLHTAMYYPANYGFIPNTLSEDGDPCDAMALSQVPVAPGAVIRCRPVGALLMEDEHGVDEKILAAPVHDLNPYYDEVELFRSAAYHARTDRALLPPLQGPRKGQMGEGSEVGRSGRGVRADPSGNLPFSAT